MDNEKVIISSSFGKDSTAMIHLMLEKGEQIDKIIYFESGWDFLQMEAHIQQVERNTGIKTIRVRYYRHFNELLSHYGWPHTSGGWCVDCKIKTCNKIIRALKGTTECIGFTTDEIKRTKRSGLLKKKWNVRFPLIEYGLSEADALEYCKSFGYGWGGLYNVFDRVSCFCCPKAGRKRIDKLKENFPELYKRYLKMNKLVPLRTKFVEKY